MLRCVSAIVTISLCVKERWQLMCCKANRLNQFLGQQFELWHNRSVRGTRIPSSPVIAGLNLVRCTMLLFALETRILIPNYVSPYHSSLPLREQVTCYKLLDQLHSEPMERISCEAYWWSTRFRTGWHCDKRDTRKWGYVMRTAGHQSSRTQTRTI